MNNLNKKIYLLFLTLLLICISIIVIVINGKTYTIKYENIKGIKNIEELNIEIEDENIIQCIDKKIENGVLKVKIKSIKEGKTLIGIKNEEMDLANYSSIYVHKLGIITFNEYMGDSNGSDIIPISIIVWLLFVLFMLISSYKQSIKENMYLYKNIVYLGLIVFITYLNNNI